MSITAPYPATSPNLMESQPIKDTNEVESETLGAKVWYVVHKILLAIANIAFFLTNPTLYSIGFLIGIIWDKQVQEIIDKIIGLWKTLPWVMAPVTVVCGFLSIQVTLTATSFLFAAHLGSTLSLKAQELLKKEEDKKAVEKAEDSEFDLEV
jgi:hypothetical protein